MNEAYMHESSAACMMSSHNIVTAFVQQAYAACADLEANHQKQSG